MELGAESKKHLQLSSLPTPSYAALRGRGPHHLVANQSRSTSAHPRVELHAGLLEAGLAFLPEGCHGLIAHPLGCLQLVFRIPGVIQGVLGDNKRWLSHRNHIGKGLLLGLLTDSLSLGSQIWPGPHLWALDPLQSPSVTPLEPLGNWTLLEKQSALHLERRASGRGWGFRNWGPKWWGH